MNSIINKLTIIVSLLILVSCSDQSVETEHCAITVDAVSIIDSIKLEDTTYFLVHRISGWSDKTEILELYNAKPIFDHCSRSNIEPVYGDSLEMSQTISHVYINKKDKMLDIVYLDGEPDKSHNANLKLELK
jgi:hypothetical protein